MGDLPRRAALLLDCHGPYPVLHAVDLDGCGAHRQRRQLQAALEHHLPGGFGSPGGEHAAAGVL